MNQLKQKTKQKIFYTSGIILGVIITITSVIQMVYKDDGIMILGVLGGLYMIEQCSYEIKIKEVFKK